MKRVRTGLAIVGGGCAGLAAAVSARENGVEDVLVLERAPAPGGVLRQCVHNGFGLHTFGEDLTGTEFAHRYVALAKEAGVRWRTSSLVLDIRSAEEGVALTVMNGDGLLRVDARAAVLATGCRERPRGNLLIPGPRPAGIFTAGTAQRYMNLEGYLVGRRIVILGSGDIGLIMARQFVLEGAEVAAIAEIMAKSGGLVRNIVQCGEDYGIPLLYRTTVSRSFGKERVEAVGLVSADERLRPVPGTERVVECDALVLSVGLIPENELAFDAGIELDARTGGPVVSDRYETKMPGVFSCGNSLYVHDLVDNVAKEGKLVGAFAAEFIRGRSA